MSKTICTFALQPLLTPSIFTNDYIIDQLKMVHHLNGKSRRRKRQRRPQWMAVVLLLPVVILLSIWVLLAHKVTFLSSSFLQEPIQSWQYLLLWNEGTNSNNRVTVFMVSGRTSNDHETNNANEPITKERLKKKKQRTTRCKW